MLIKHHRIVTLQSHFQYSSQKLVDTLEEGFLSLPFKPLNDIYHTLGKIQPSLHKRAIAINIIQDKETSVNPCSFSIASKLIFCCFSDCKVHNHSSFLSKGDQCPSMIIVLLILRFQIFLARFLIIASSDGGVTSMWVGVFNTISHLFVLIMF